MQARELIDAALKQTRISQMLADWHRELPGVVGPRIREGQAKPNKMPIGRP